ncbi:MAG: DEAD/DEAH box helicase, partial [Crocinitomicaceae bacterium]|nr:DEAD/DEAH box helicase [Crocinitomicaceae bacterium]
MNITEAIKNAGHEALLDIQSKCVDAVQSNPELVLLSKTGSGKTLAFLLSVLSKMDPNKKNVQGLIIAPTRELCQQIETVFKSLKSNYKVTLCYGGHPMKIERNSLASSPSLIIATPGRLCDHIDRGHIDLATCHFLVIDEFDKCLEFGFGEDMSYIARKLTRLRNKLLVSATNLSEIPDYLQMKNPFEINALTTDSDINITEYAIEYKNDII